MTDMPYRIDGSKIWLSADARDCARMCGLSDAEYGRYLMKRHRLGDNFDAALARVSADPAGRIVTCATDWIHPAPHVED